MDTRKTRKRKKPLLSVVVPVHNDTMHLGRSVGGALAQLSALGPGCGELVVVDDASTDGSSDMAEALVECEGSRVRARVVRLKRQAGPGASRNAGVRKASGEYVYFHDSDDWIGENALAGIVAAIEKHGHPDVVCVPLSIWDGQNEPKAKPVPYASVEDSAYGPPSPMAQTFKRELYVPMPEGTLAEDAPWHFIQWDRFRTFGKVEVDEKGTPYYVWDRTNARQITATISASDQNPMTLEVAFGTDYFCKDGRRDRWVSDFLRNVANMYDARHYVKNQQVKRALACRFRMEVQNLMTGRYCH